MFSARNSLCTLQSFLFRRSAVAVWLSVYWLHSLLAFGAAALHIANNDADITLEPSRSFPSVVGLANFGCPDWRGLPTTNLIDHVETGSRVRNISWRLNASLTRR